jgi:iron complex transport system substrate-binding protein
MRHKLGQLRAKILHAGLLVFAVTFNAPSGIADGAGGTASHPLAPGYDSSRIVSIGGSITEILYALGKQQNIVAVDTTSLYPPRALQEKPNVGYMRQLSAEGVLGLSPTLILAIDGSGPKQTIDVLQQAKVAFITVPDTFTGGGIIDKIGTIARNVGAPGRGECLAGAVRNDLAALDAIRQQIRQRAKVAFILSLANGRPMLAGRGTAADGIIAMAGASNAFDDFDGYKMVDDESIVAAKPDAVLVMQRGEHALSADTVFSQPALAMTPAAEHKTLIAMEGLYLLGFGPRTVRAARDLAAALYPDAKGWVLPSEQSANAVSCDR